MASAWTTITSQDTAESAAWRRFCAALGVVALAVGVGCVVYGVETLLLRCERRCVENPTDSMTRVFGLAHFAVGLLFLVTSRRLRRPRNLTRVALAGLGGIGLCALYYLGGGSKSPIVLLLFYGLFLVHEVGDEAEMFRRDDAPPLPPGGDRVLRALAWTVSLGLLTLLAGVQLAHGLWLGRTPILRAADPTPLLLGWAGLALLTALAGVRLALLGRRLLGGWAEVVTLSGPLLRVYAGITVLLAVGSLLGSVGLNLIILLHVAVWLVFVHGQLRREGKRAANPWQWLRQTPAGFLTLHLGVAAVVLLLFALRVHVWDRSGWFCVALAKSSFPYWSLLHIGLTLVRLR